MNMWCLFLETKFWIMKYKFSELDMLSIFNLEDDNFHNNIYKNKST